MTALERRASFSLASIFALRMLGLFLVLPVFALGSFLAAAAPDLNWLLAGRALQGAGAISAAVTALLADQTRDEVRTKAMALVGGSIGLMFAVSLVLAPALNARIGLGGLFVLTGVLALAGIVMVLWLVPPEPLLHKDMARGGLGDVLRRGDLVGLNFGVFVLHAVQLSMWVAVPALLVQAGLLKALHWQVYLPAVLASFVVMGGTLFPLERRGHLRAVLLAAIALLALVQLGFLGMAIAAGGASPSLWMLGGLLLLFFCSFNVLEASQPSLVSRLAHASNRGAALGLYNTSQSLGLFAGGALGGALLKWGGAQGLFVATTALSLIWLAVAWRLMPVQPAAARKVPV